LDNRPIGVFDSGVGGLTVLREIISIVPDESIIYFGDTERFPYGPRDLAEVRHFAFKITEFLSNCAVKLIVVACNTSTAAALEDLKREFDIPIIGVIEPGARTAAGSTIKNKIGVIATKGTVASRDYEFAVKEINPDIDVYQVAAPLLVEYIEKGILSGSDLKKLICEYVEPLNQYDIDILILGCTHFPIIEGEIKSCCNEGIKVISSAVETARDVKHVLDANQIKSVKSLNPGRIFYETGNTSKFLEISKIFLGSEIKEVKKVKLNMY
jgi:glutamate racemase